jgi:peptidoglycan/LPS O-acetylase OafA/YrhL
LLAASIAAYALCGQLDPESMGRKLAAVWVLPYLWNFLVGVIAARYWPIIEPWIRARAGWWCAAFIAWTAVMGVWLDLYNPTYWPNAPGWIAMVLLSGAVLAVAYTRPGIATRWLGGTDVSYGVYLYHMVVLNTLITLGIGGFGGAALTVLGACALGYASWRVVERPALGQKAKVGASVSDLLRRLRPVGDETR